MPADSACSRIGCHNDNDIAEIRFSALIICQCGIIHGLKQQVIDIRVRFFHFIQQQHRVRIFPDCLCEQASLLITHIPCRGTDKFCHRMFFFIFAHVEAYQADPQLPGKASGNFRLTYSGRPHEQQARQRLSIFQKPGS